jgi:iron(III) transport system substrate-binding protein
MQAPRPVLVLCALLLAACGREPDVVIYCALDQVHSEPLLRRFEQETGLVVRAEFDVEAHKTVGLVKRIREEQNRPRCDVFWNNEIVHTVALAEDGFLAAYDSPSAADVPDAFRDPERRWTGFAARARILIVNTDRIDASAVSRVEDLADPKWRGQCAMARPLTGTTLTHFASLIDVIGDAETFALLARVRANDVQLLGGNAQVMHAVADGRVAFGLTDSDDFNVAREGGRPVAAVYPDQDGVGTLVIPNTIAILKDAPHPEAARRLVDWCLRPEIEAELAASRSAQIPVRAGVARPPEVRSAADFEVMAVDFARVGRDIAARQQRFNAVFRE